jgi:hypothetical protein
MFVPDAHDSLQVCGSRQLLPHKVRPTFVRDIPRNSLPGRERLRRRSGVAVVASIVGSALAARRGLASISTAVRLQDRSLVVPVGRNGGDGLLVDVGRLQIVSRDSCGVGGSLERQILCQHCGRGGLCGGFCPNLMRSSCGSRCLSTMMGEATWSWRQK